MCQGGMVACTQVTLVQMWVRVVINVHDVTFITLECKCHFYFTVKKSIRWGESELDLISWTGKEAVGGRRSGGGVWECGNVTTCVWTCM